MPALRLRVLLIAVALLLAACGRDDGRLGPSPRLETAGRFADVLPYRVDFQGVADEDLRELLATVSTLVELQDDPPQGRLGLRRRAEADSERLLTALRSEGYHAASVEIVLGEGEPVPVTIAVDTGPRFVFVPPVVRRVGAAEAPVPADVLDPAELPIEPGAPARAPIVVEATTDILEGLRDVGFPYPEITQRRVVVDHAAQAVRVEFDVATGPIARLGPVTFRGIDDVDESYVANRVPWEPGQLYDPDLLDEFRSALAARPLFSEIAVTPAEEVGPDGILPVTVTLTERPARFIGFGAQYSTQTAFGVNAYWGHRNLFGGAERLRIAAAVDRIGEEPIDRIAGLDYTLAAEFEKPDFFRPDQVLDLNAAATVEHPEAYERRAVELGALVERQVTDEWTVGAGLTLERAYYTGPTPNQNTALIGLPLTTTYDNTENPLDPVEGFRATAALTPYWDLFGTGFTTLRTGASAYFPIGEEARTVLAGRVGIGSTLGGADAQIPPDKRFYGGGGGSVRGYGYQMLGPLDEQGRPIGGRSLIELGAEARFRVGENWGVVPFFDAGTVSEEYVADLLGNLRYGAGLGIRYFTPLGPVRLDVAVPLNPRPEDDRYQIYISLGQAF